MNPRLQIKGILLLLIITSAALLVGIVLYAQEQVRQASVIVTEDRKISLDQISNRLELRFNDAITILQITSKNDHITSTPSASLIDNKLNGIPENVDADRRKVMHDVFDTYGIFQNMLFLLPNGNVYINEPFVFQQNMTASNFAFRDWFKDVITSHNPVVSQVVVSKSSGKPNVVIAVPVFSQNKTLQGILTGSLSLDKMQEQLEGFKSYADERILITDNANTIVADSDRTLKGQKASFATQDIQKALSGESGTTTDTVNGTEMFVAYHPIKTGQATWAIISIQPYDEAFQSINGSIRESYAFAILIALITSISGYFLYNAFRARIKLAQELEKQSQRLQEVDKEKEEFSAMVTHELKTPLVPILGYCKMLKTSMLGKLNEEEKNAIEVIEKNTKALEQLITDIMDIRKLDIGKMKFQFENFHVNELFDDLDSSYKKILKNKGIEFATKLSDKDISIRTDKARLRQVFDNLIGNSIKFVSENKGLIEVGGYKENNSLILYVKDNGIGIPKDKQTKLFKKFYQVDTSLTRSSGGTGLGLAISKGIMDNLGGSIWVESDGKTGTTLYLKLPL